jgi:hypothetical protein
MDQLEFALVPVGIVLGCGVTKISVAWADVIHSWPHIRRPPLIYLSATAICLCFMSMNFSGLWAYKGVNFRKSFAHSAVHILFWSLLVLGFGYTMIGAKAA